MSSLQTRQDELSYLGQLERLLVKKLRRTEDADIPLNRSSNHSHLNQVSIEINEELDRIEQLILEEKSLDAAHATM